MKKCFWLLLILIRSTATLNAQQATASSPSIADKLDEYLTAASLQHRFNGTALVAKKGKILLQKGYGWNNVSTKIPNDTNSIYQLGSITKTFTGAAILLLQDEGKLAVTDKLSKYLPDYPRADQISLEQLFIHTSGIYDFKNLLYSPDSTERARLTRPVPKEWLVRQFSQKPMTGKPGAAVNYTNSGYYLLGLVVEKITGLSFETVVRERFLRPLQLTHTGFDFINLKTGGKTTGYTFQNDSVLVPTPIIDSTVAYAAGGMYSTVGDLYRWSRVVQNRRLLKPDTWESALSPPNNGNWGYGWGVSTFQNDKKLIFQNGNLPGFATYYIQFPQDDITLILLSNVDDASDITSPEPTVRDLINIVYDLPYQLPKNRKIVSVAQPVLTQYIGRYRHSDDRIMAITMESGQLFLQITGQPRFEVYAESDTEFFLKVVDAQLTFRKNETGQVAQVVVRQGGHDYAWKRL
ncbi:serine hydrolase [Spirosoma aureum]|uniref:Serine hydrolase n=1 Tax=Spirosoma aureum TaxID=2692134 RepID=A0A6G9AQV5_9BACT|nr:serine hydrolase [Spirosoma aureum]QIP14593.1 serine hydrolase [Spirosoma aureum]